MTILKISLPGFDVHNSSLDEDVVNSLYPSPKINVKANPPHVGIINLDWRTAGLIIPSEEVRVLYSFPHGYNYVPTVFASVIYNPDTSRFYATLPFTINATLGLITIDADEKNVNLKYISVDIFGVAVTPFKMQVKFYVFAERGHE